MAGKEFTRSGLFSVGARVEGCFRTFTGALVLGLVEGLFCL